MKKRINTTWLRTLTAVLLTSLLALLAAGCGGGGDGVTPPPPTATTLNAVLSGTQEVPAVTSTATGTATVTVDAAKTTITVILNATGLTGVTASHIHFGATGVNGGVMFSLLAAPATFTSPLTKTLTSADFTPVAASGINTFTDAVNAILAGNAYINVHTTANVGGEIRGQVGPVSLAAATLTGAQEVQTTPVVTTASGNATVKFDNTQSAITIILNTTGLTTVTASHIHFGKVGANGLPLFSLFSAPGTFTPILTKTLSITDFTPDAANGINSFSDAVNALLSGNTYINVHTQANAAGEIRGQVGPAAFKATLNGNNEVPIVVSPATGTAKLRFNADQTAITLNMPTQGFVNTVTASHIHFGAVTTNNATPLFSLFVGPGAFPATLTKTLTSADFTQDAANGVTTFAGALNAILSGNTYINVHTNANLGGEIRGQVTPE